MSAFLDGLASYPNKRINYPLDLETEKEWLKGYYQAERESQLDAMEGVDTHLWLYKKG